MTAKVAATRNKTIGNSRACASRRPLNRQDTMQYITQCPHYSRLITRRFRKDNYLLFQIVKEQPIVPAIPRGITNQVRVAKLIAVPSVCVALLVEPIGIEPMTSCLQSR